VSATGRSGRTEQITRLLTIPDFACLWVGPAVRAGVKLGRRAEAEVVFASGPPFSALVVGSRVSRRLGIPLVADFRDAWRDNPGNASYPSTWHRNRALALERSVLGTAVRVTTAHPMAAEIVEMGGPIPTFIPNGFDPADLPVWSPRRGGPLVVTFMGTFYGVNDPLPVFKALQQVREGADEETHDIRLRIVGTWPSYVESVAAELGLEGAVEFQPYLPHREALDVLAASDVGLVVYADLPALRVSTPAKLYEYLAIGLPVLFVGPSEGAAPDLVREARAGLVVRYADQSGIAAALAGFARQKSEGVLGSDLRRAVVARFDRRLQAEALARVLEEATGA
jgi:glycosyltransferase involved in cell wall biosynthesis